MMREVNEKDWKLFRKKIGIWQENYMQKLNNQYIELLQSDHLASENFWELEKRISKDKRSVGVVVDMRRSKMKENIFTLIRDQAITFEDLDGFTEDLKSEIQYMVEYW